MDVSMDGLRWQLINNYNSLTKKLNKNIKKYETFSDEINISPDDIQKELDNIRHCIAILACMYKSGEFDVMETELESFNDKED